MKRRLCLVLPALGLVVLAAFAGGAFAGDGPPAPRSDAPVEQRAERRGSADRSKPRLATWREAARPPAEVPPTAIVRAAKRDRVGGAAPGKRPAGQPAKPEPVEIIWHAPGS